MNHDHDKLYENGSCVPVGLQQQQLQDTLRRLRNAERVGKVRAERCRELWEELVQTRRVRDQLVGRCSRTRHTLRAYQRERTIPTLQSQIRTLQHRIEQLELHHKNSSNQNKRIESVQRELEQCQTQLNQWSKEQQDHQTLCDAVVKGDVDTVRQCLARAKKNENDNGSDNVHMNVTAPGVNEESILRYAVVNGHAEMTRILLQYCESNEAGCCEIKQANTEQHWDHFWHDEVISACRHGHDAVLQVLLEYEYRYTSDNGTDTDTDAHTAEALHAACRSGHVRCVERLLNQTSVGPDAVDGYGNTPLHTVLCRPWTTHDPSTSTGTLMPMVQLLVAHQASVHQLNADGQDALTLANLHHRHDHILLRLLEQTATQQTFLSTSTSTSKSTHHFTGPPQRFDQSHPVLPGVGNHSNPKEEENDEASMELEPYFVPCPSLP